MISVCRGIGTSVPEKVEKGADTWCYQVSRGEGVGFEL